MTDLLSRSSRVAVGRSGPPRLLVAGVAGLWSAGLGVLGPTVVVLLIWATSASPGYGAATAVRTAAQIWLAAHRVALAVPGGEFALMPLGLTALQAGLLYRAGGWAAAACVAPVAAKSARAGRRSESRAAVLLTAGLAGGYGLAATAAAALAATAGVRPDVSQALGHGVVLATVAGGVGVVASTPGLRRALSGRIGPGARAALTGACGAVAMLIAGGALLGVVSLILHRDRARELTESLAPGWAGMAGLFLLCLVLVPNLSIWGAGYAAGPGFAVGAGTAVAPTGIHLGAVPALPLLAALPAERPPAVLAWAPILIPAVAGVVAGALVGRTDPEADGARRTAAGLAAGLGAGVALAVLAVLSGGAAGPGRMAVVGPPPLPLGVAVALEVGLVAAVTAGPVRRVLASRR